MKSSSDVDDYIAGFPPKVQTLLRKMRATIKQAAPKASQRISYGMPAFLVNAKVLVWYAAFTSHIGFYPKAAAIAAFKKELALYKFAKGSVQFPFTEALPVDLIGRMVEFRLEQERRS